VLSGSTKGLSGLLSQYAQDSDTEDSDEDVDTSVYDVEAGEFDCRSVEMFQLDSQIAGPSPRCIGSLALGKLLTPVCLGHQTV